MFVASEANSNLLCTTQISVATSRIQIHLDFSRLQTSSRLAITMQCCSLREISIFSSEILKITQFLGFSLVI